MKKLKTPHTIEINYKPGKGFSVTISQSGECRACPDSFTSLLAAARFAEKMLDRAGFATKEAPE